MSSEPVRRGGHRLLTTVGAWLAAYLVVMVINFFWGSRLAALPTWASALILSGVLATFMVNAAMPVINRLLRTAAEPVQDAATTERVE